MRKRTVARLLGLLILYGTVTAAIPLTAGLLAGMSAEDRPADVTPQKDAALSAHSVDESPQRAALTAAATVRVWDEAVGHVLTLTPAEYLLGASAGEMPQSYADEAIKAQIVAAHSYYEYCRVGGSFGLSDGAVLTVNTARREGYLTPQVREELWGERYEANTARMQQLVEQTLEQLVTWDGAAADTCYHACSTGQTADAADVWGTAVPYLVSVESPWDTETAGFQQTQTFTRQQMKEVLTTRFVGPDLSGEPQSWFGESTVTPQGYVTAVRVGGALVDAAQLREQLGLRSTAFEITYADGVFAVTTRGYGHGVGMSQMGANALAAQGKSCEEILRHYYPGTVLQTAQLTEEP